MLGIEGSQMGVELSEGKIIQTLDWVYDKALNGIPGVGSAYELAESYMDKGGSKKDQVSALIRWQNTKAGTYGFITGLGGIITIPVNLSSVWFVQIRMIAAIAHIGGHDIQNDQVKALVYACLTGNAAKDIMKDIGIVVGKKMTTNAIKSISGKTLTAINKKVGFRLVTKFGEKGAINLGKAVPLVGGVIGAAFDSVTTNTVGNIARDIFIEGAGNA